MIVRRLLSDQIQCLKQRNTVGEQIRQLRQRRRQQLSPNRTIKLELEQRLLCRRDCHRKQRSLCQHGHYIAARVRRDQSFNVLTTYRSGDISELRHCCPHVNFGF